MLEEEETAETIHTSVLDVLPVVSHRQDWMEEIEVATITTIVGLLLAVETGKLNDISGWFFLLFICIDSEISLFFL
jgi:hypothetical protein